MFSITLCIPFMISEAAIEHYYLRLSHQVEYEINNKGQHFIS